MPRPSKRVGKADDADGPIGVVNRRAGCATTLTFEKHASDALLEMRAAMGSASRVAL